MSVQERYFCLFAATSIKARKLVKLLQDLITQKGKPAYIRCDNGLEFISQVLEKFAKENGIEIRFSQPRKPTQNGHVERLNDTRRKEYLNLKYFKTVQQSDRRCGATILGHMMEFL